MRLLIPEGPTPRREGNAHGIYAVQILRDMQNMQPMARWLERPVHVERVRRLLREHRVVALIGAALSEHRAGPHHCSGRGGPHARSPPVVVIVLHGRRKLAHRRS
jgi:hypothetical protein